ncbi:PLP-dependent aminotransferase family protein [Gordonia sp. CPCC 205333]|uniref:aminotransferase-like domain-containing protein n=1 Tax=Gordonia sp. CPCC 205333 TaxID=3140790 RepID=UPI003AF393FF
MTVASSPRQLEELLSRRARSLSMSAPYAVPSAPAGAPLINFVNGAPAAEALPADAIADAARLVVSERPGRSLGYGPNAGDPRLRELIAARYQVDPQRVVVTNGGLHAVQLVLATTIEPGSAVVVDTPTFPDAIRLVENAGGRIVAVPTVNGTSDVDRIEEILDADRGESIRVVYSLPDHHNPAGGTLPYAQRIRLLEAAERNGVVVISDNPYRELSFDALESDFPTESANLTIAGTFSKTLGPGLRLGWAVAPAWAVPHLINQRRRQDFQPSALAQALVLQLLDGHDDWFARLIASATTVYRDREERAASGLAAAGDVIAFSRPRGGFFHWITVVDPSIDLTEVDQRLRQRGIVISRGTFYDPTFSGRYDDHFRIAYSRLPVDQLEAGVQAIAEELTAR